MRRDMVRTSGSGLSRDRPHRMRRDVGKQIRSGRRSELVADDL
jgi:hypothetical protein